MDDLILRLTNADSEKDVYVNFSNVCSFGRNPNESTFILFNIGDIDRVSETPQQIVAMLKIKRERGDYYGD